MNRLLISNVSGNAYCRHCDDGLVVVNQPGVGRANESGPCPYCEKGARHELRIWHGEFWQGRNPNDYLPPAA